MKMKTEPEMQPPPTYNIPVVCLIVGIALTAVQIYELMTRGVVHVAVFFITPGAMLQGCIGLWNPIIPSFLQPGATGYPPYAKVVANGCWVASAIIGVVFWFLLRSAGG